MCGLFCIISKSEYGFTDRQINIFTQGLFADTLRGEDSTGAFSVTKSGNVHTIKDAVPGHTFIKDKNFDDFLKDQYLYSKILVGHNRSATRGVKTDKNAHPFISGNTVLVHNGTLLSHHHLANTNTDSEAICIALDKEENPINILSELDGAFALIWYNAKTKQFHVSRNNQRPLWILETEHYDLIGSEAKLLEWISWRNGGKDIEAKYFEENMLYTWELDKVQDGFEHTTKYEKKKIQTPFTIKQKPTKTIGKMAGDTTNLIRILPDLNLFYNTPIKVTITDSKVLGEHIKVMGINTEYPQLTFQTIIHKSVCPDLNKQTEILCLPHTRMTQFDKITLYCIYDPQLLLLKTINNTSIILNKEQQKCSHCSQTITQDDDKKIWIRYTKFKTIKTILCPKCVAKNDNLSFMYAENQT